MHKLFAITKDVKLQFQADFFNVFKPINLNDATVSLSRPANPNRAYGTIFSVASGRDFQLRLELRQKESLSL